METPVIRALLLLLTEYKDYYQEMIEAQKITTKEDLWERMLSRKELLRKVVLLIEAHLQARDDIQKKKKKNKS